MASLGLGYTEASHEALFSESDLIFAVGGDGTILHTAKVAALYGKPVLGINSGRLGFMAALECNELARLSDYFDGNYEKIGYCTECGEIVVIPRVDVFSQILGIENSGTTFKDTREGVLCNNTGFKWIYGGEYLGADRGDYVLKFTLSVGEALHESGVKYIRDNTDGTSGTGGRPLLGFGTNCNSILRMFDDENNSICVK